MFLTNRFHRCIVSVSVGTVLLSASQCLQPYSFPDTCVDFSNVPQFSGAVRAMRQTETAHQFSVQLRTSSATLLRESLDSGIPSRLLFLQISLTCNPVSINCRSFLSRHPRYIRIQLINCMVDWYKNILIILISFNQIIDIKSELSQSCIYPLLLKLIVYYFCFDFVNAKHIYFLFYDSNYGNIYSQHKFYSKHARVMVFIVLISPLQRLLLPNTDEILIFNTNIKYRWLLISLFKTYEFIFLRFITGI